MSNKVNLFTQSHEWVRVEDAGGTERRVCAVVGISSYAQKELGEIVAVGLPEVGQSVLVGQEVCVLESTKAAADVYAPVSGKLLGVNKSLIGDLRPINEDPEAAGWLFRIELSDPSELDRLLNVVEYRNLVVADDSKGSSSSPCF